MNRADLLKYLERFEWNDFEVKEAQWAVPKNVYETVSAFANTRGGHVVFGVAEESGRFEIVGVIGFDKVQNEFLSTLRSRQKVSVHLETKEDVIEHDGRQVLAFYIPEASKQDKPVYLNADIRSSFIRRGASDQKCSEDDIRRFLRNAGGPSHESELIDLDPVNCFDSACLQRYRQQYARLNPNTPINDLDDIRFLEHWGLIVERRGGHLCPTRASILLFGTGRALRSVLSRPIVDLRWHAGTWDAAQEEQRWLDRLVCEDNLFLTWDAILGRYANNVAKPFALDYRSMEREERPENFVSFREASVNLLIHQDYAESGRAGSIAFHSDRLVFTNPGTARPGKDALLEPGEKEVRNPLIVAAFRRIGLSEQAGSGVRAIYADWTRRGRVKPQIEDNVAEYLFRISLIAEPLLSERQLLFQASLGVNLSEAEADAFANLCREPQVGRSELRAVLGLAGAEVDAVLDRLILQVLARRVEGPRGTAFELAEHLRGRWPLPGRPGTTPVDAGSTATNLVTDQAPRSGADLVTDQAPGTPDARNKTLQRPLIAALTEQQRMLLSACDTPRPQRELMELLKVSHRAHFREFHLQPLLSAGLLQLQYPDSPRHPRQRYVLTEIGAQIVQRSINSQPDGAQ
jgi:ATP-dependent DNA helicase RecG